MNSNIQLSSHKSLAACKLHIKACHSVNNHTFTKDLRQSYSADPCYNCLISLLFKWGNKKEFKVDVIITKPYLNATSIYLSFTCNFNTLKINALLWNVSYCRIRLVILPVSLYIIVQIQLVAVCHHLNHCYPTKYCYTCTCLTNLMCFIIQLIDISSFLTSIMYIQRITKI